MHRSRARLQTQRRARAFPHQSTFRLPQCPPGQNPAKSNSRSKESGLDVRGNARSAAYLDFDGDGDLDIAVNSYHGPVLLFRNDSPVDVGSRWLKLRLVGDPSRGVSLDAVGARVVVNGKSIRGLWREVHSTIGYLSVHPKELHFGVGAEQELEVEIAWPDGTIQKFDHLRPTKRFSLKMGGTIE